MSEPAARRTRPRDALGRPLDWDAVGVPPVDESPRPPIETLDAARALIASGRPFAAHEVLEGRWKSCPEAERGLWQGLAQLAVALTHAGRGNARGASRLVERGAGRLAEYEATSGPTYGLDLGRVVAGVRRAVG